MRIITACFLLFTFYFLLFTPSYAQEDDIGQSQITPASPLYFLKSVREILELKFAGTTHVRAIREFEFATRRIREAKGLVKTSRQDLIEPTLYRYLFHLEEFIGIANFKDPDFASQVSKNITGQMNVLQAVYNHVSDKRALMSIRATINSLSKWDLKLIDKLGLAEKPLLAEQIAVSRLSACNFLSHEASSSALNEVERAVFSERTKQCLTPKL
ncbi:MAG: DUF5667 domain-containing protein [Candidatus Daviesbacteria bacterium]|nr:DUF5667 domain-containing protein [Candidatus Daviesbacteria bacterium]